ncbi:MAG TPA: hypothetical protein VKZ57_02680 [Sphingobacterium sp.]|nr:hypothetical protein [Sphingobacterium sp.]
METQSVLHQDKDRYQVYDEMACEVILTTDDPQLAIDTAYNYQSLLIDNHSGKILRDFSC